MSDKQRVLMPVEGFAPGIGACLASMEEVRAQLHKAVEGLPDETIARRLVPGAHSIGALVLHIGEAEWWWMHCVVGGNEFKKEDCPAACWDSLLKEASGEDFAARGLTAQDCLAAVDEIRVSTTRRVLAALKDEDLDRFFMYNWHDTTLDVSLRWVLHRLFDHEAQHKGQILMLKRLLLSQEDDGR